MKGGGKWGETGREVGIGYPPVHPLNMSLAFKMKTFASEMGLFQKVITHKVSKGAKIRNQYNQVPHLTQDTNGKVTNS